MAAYAAHQRELPTRLGPDPLARLQLVSTSRGRSLEGSGDVHPTDDADIGAALVTQLVNQFADRVAAAVAQRLAHGATRDDEWYDSRHAAEYLGVHRDTLRKLAAERTIPAEQDGPGCKLYFRRSDLDTWRRSGGRPRHLASIA